MPKSEQQKHRSLMKWIQAYSRETGIPTSVCINEALAEWKECCGEPRLEAFRAKPKSVVPAMFMVGAEKAS